jgi:molybdate transport system regulatory protein
MKPKSETKQIRSVSRISVSKSMNHGRIVSIPDEDQCLDTTQLDLMEHSFREWTDSSPRADIRFSRRRILIIFLLIRYTGAKLNEVLALNPLQDIDPGRHALFFRATGIGMQSHPREVQISEALSNELRDTLADPAFQEVSPDMLAVDPGFVRRKFYERAQACGFSKRLGGPEMIRRARAVELMQGNMPLPAVQMMLGHSTPNLTSSYVTFSENEIQQVARLFMERESMRKTSARNSFFGKIQTIQKGDIQTRLELVTLSGYRVTTVITNDSLQRLDLKTGKLITAEVKAPWVMLQKNGNRQGCSVDNMFKGVVEKITKGEINSEYIVRISDGTEMCAVVTSESCRRLALVEGDEVWALFNSYSVILLCE